MNRRGGFSLAAAPAAALLFAFACGGGLAAGRKSPGALESGSFKPTRAPAANYGPDPSLTCPDRGVNSLVNDELSGTAAKPEGRLCAVADTLLGWEGSDAPPENVMAVISSDFGLPAMVRSVVLATMETAEESSKGTTQGASQRDVASRIAEPIKSFAGSAQVPRYGVAVMRVKKGISKIAVVMQDQNFEIQPVPRKLNPGQSATLSGTVAGKLSNPKVQFTDAVGQLQKGEPQAGNAFKTDLKCGDRPGRILVQVTAEQEGADMLLATFPVGCGVDLPIAAAVGGMIVPAAIFIGINLVGGHPENIGGWAVPIGTDIAFALAVLAVLSTHLPTALRKYCGGSADLPISASTIQAALRELQSTQPSLYVNLCDETGAVRRHLNVFVNSDHMRDRDGLDTALRDGDVVTILAAVSGG